MIVGFKSIVEAIIVRIIFVLPKSNMPYRVTGNSKLGYFYMIYKCIISNTV